MGDTSSSSVTQNQIAPLSATGQSYQSLLQGMINAQIQESGYAITPTQTTTYQNPDQAAQDQAKITQINGQIATVQKQLASTPPGQASGPLLQQLNSLQSQLSTAQNSLNANPKTSYTSYSVSKQPDPQVQAAINQFGAGSPQAVAAENAVNQQATDKANALANVNTNYLNSIQKLVSGDLSYTPEQQAQNDAYYAPIRDVVNKAASSLMTQVQGDDAALGQKLNSVIDQINQTGVKTSDALQAASIQMDKNQTDLLTTLQNVNTSTEANYKFQQDLMFQQIDKQAASQAAMLGLPPNSQLEQNQRAKMRVDASTQLTLQLNQQEAQGALGIAEQTAQGKQQIAFSYVNLAQSQGAALQSAAQEGLALSQATFGKEENIQSQMQSALLATQQSEQGALYQNAVGNLAGRVAAGQGAQAFGLQMKSGQQALDIGAMAPLIGQLSVQQQQQAQNATQTNNTKQTSSIMSDIGSGIGLATSVAAPFVSGGIGLPSLATAASANAGPASSGLGGTVNGIGLTGLPPTFNINSNLTPYPTNQFSLNHPG